MSVARPALNVDTLSYSSSAAMSHPYSGYSTPSTSSFASSSTMTTPSRSSRNGSTSPTSLRHTGAYRRSGSLGLSASTYAAVIPPPEEDLSTDQVKDKSKALLELVSSGMLSLEAVLAFPLDWTKVFDQQQQQATQALNSSTSTSSTSQSSTTREDAPPRRKKQRRPASLPIEEPSTSSAPSSAVPIVSPTFSDVSSISAPARPFSPLGSSSLSSSRDESVDPLCTSSIIAPHRKLTIIERRRIAKQTRVRLAAAATRAMNANAAAAGEQQSTTDSMWLHSWSYSWATPAATTTTTTMIGSPQQSQFSSKGLDGTDADGDSAIPDLVIELPKLSFSAAAMRAAPARPAVPDHWQPARHQVPAAVAPL